MRTFCLSTLGCKVNQYESEQVASLLRSRGLVQTTQAETADLRIINTCSVTIQAASKSRQTVRRQTRLPGEGSACQSRARVLVIGCWATSNRADAQALAGVDAVLSHRENLAGELDRLLAQWATDDTDPSTRCTTSNGHREVTTPESLGYDGWMIQGGIPAPSPVSHNQPQPRESVKEKIVNPAQFGARSLPLLDCHQSGHQRAFLKIQDGCDAHCTYCIIPRLRPGLWSKPVADVVEEARRLVDAGHVEIVLTGIFLGAYGQSTALHRRQPAQDARPLAALVDALCSQVPGLQRLRLSSLEPADLSSDLLAALRSHPQVVPHFHLPLQSGSDQLLRRMNRQYLREDFLAMADRLRNAFDRPAITTDIIVGFPGETEAEFQQTLEVVDRVGFIHIHAFAYSPRPGTAAARWAADFVRGPVVNQRIELLREHARRHSFAFRQQFVGDIVDLLVELPSAEEAEGGDLPGQRHGRCRRYFPVWFEGAEDLVGRCVRVRIDRVTPQHTLGTLVDRL